MRTSMTWSSPHADPSGGGRRLRSTPALLWLAATLGVAAPATSLDLLFTAATGVEPHPCDCPTEPYGGWAPRAALVDSLRDAGDGLWLDAGGWLAGDPDPAAVPLAIEVMGLLAYDVINLGPDELHALGDDVPSGLPFVSGHPARPAGVPALQRISSGGLEVLVIGTGWFGEEVASPAEQIVDALATLDTDDSPDLVVALCAGGFGPARLVGTLPGVDVVLYGGGARTPRPVRLDRTAMVAPGTKGRYVGQVEVDPRNPAGARFTLHAVRSHLRGPDRLQELADRAAYAIDAGDVLGKRFVYHDE